jgi:hypothetical protein
MIEMVKPIANTLGIKLRVCSLMEVGRLGKYPPPNPLQANYQ